MGKREEQERVRKRGAGSREQGKLLCIQPKFEEQEGTDGLRGGMWK